MHNNDFSGGGKQTSSLVISNGTNPNFNQTVGGKIKNLTRQQRSLYVDNFQAKIPRN